MTLIRVLLYLELGAAHAAKERREGVMRASVGRVWNMFYGLFRSPAKKYRSQLNAVYRDAQIRCISVRFIQFASARMITRYVFRSWQVIMSKEIACLLINTVIIKLLKLLFTSIHPSSVSCLFICIIRF